jgi:photoactive yellow protein
MEVSDNENSTITFGMFELDAAGTVIHYSPAAEDQRGSLSANIVGRNFFDRLASITEVEELKNRFMNFMADGTSFERFTISFPYNQESVKVQIVMAHVSEKSENGRERFALLRVMPETRFSVPQALIA